MTTYDYTVEGEAAGGQRWTTTGDVTSDRDGDFPKAVMAALQDSFQQLTEGKATYGQPGLGCVGPYRILKLIVSRRS